MWLEDQKIRHYKIEERDGLRNIEKDSWKDAFNTYQKDLVSPVLEGTPNEQLNWLLSYAVRLEYADNGMYLYFKTFNNTSLSLGLVLKKYSNPYCTLLHDGS